MFQKRLQFYRSVLFACDLALVAVCWLGSYFLRFYAPVVPVTKGVPDLSLYLTLLFLVLAVFAATLPAMGLYKRPWASPGQVWFPVARAVALGVLLAVSLTYFLRPYDFSRLVFLHFWVLTTVAMLAARPVLQWAWRRTHPQEAGEGVIIVGVEDLGREVAANIKKHPELGLRIAGFVTRRPSRVGGDVDGSRVLGLYNELPTVLAEHDAQVVIIALPLDAHDRIIEIMNQLADEMVDVKIVPDLFRFMALRGSVEEFEGMPIIGVRGSPLEGWGRVAKRLMDIAGSLTAILLFSPLMLAAALAVKLTSRGPVLYRQERMGMDGRVFTMLKFRSMRCDAEAECGPVWAQPGDPRCTPVGRLMRRTSIDEFPQFFNVLRGDMSLVGPRPERPEFIADFRKNVPRYMLRHKMKAGITGWAQVNGWRGNTSLERRIEYDIQYIENWSPWLDIKIIFRTLALGFVGPNAY